MNDENKKIDDREQGHVGEQHGKIFGQAKDGTKFYKDSEQVVKYMEKYPDVSLEAALGSVVNMYENGQTF